MTSLIAIGLTLIGALAPPVSLSSGSARDRSPAATAEARGRAEEISAAQMRDYLTFIASDELEGRDTPSRGLDIAALFIATHLSRWGLRPAGDNGTYFQSIGLRRTTIDAAASQATFGGRVFHYGVDFLAQPFAATVSAPAVYVGHGWMIKSKGIDAYRGLDVKDKIVVTHNLLPKGITPNDITGKQGEDWANAQLYGQKHGAKAVIVIPGFAQLANWQQAIRNATEKGIIALEKAPATPQLPVVVASPQMLALLFRGERQTAAAIVDRFGAGDPVPAFQLNTNKIISLNVAAKAEPAVMKNVVAVLEGSDPVLKNEYVALGAHYDHVGMGAPNGGDAIFNGADDDGSGTVAVLAMAEAFAKAPRPKRSILFVWHAGEEKGLWGAQYFTSHPAVPINQIIAQLNIDMIGRSKKPGDTKPGNKELANPGEVFVIGSRMMSTELGEISDAVNRGYLNLKFNFKYDDPADPNKYFFRSDHYHYALKGVPIIFYMDGDHEDYHQPSDSIDKIDFEQMEKITRTIYATAWELATRPRRPVVDKALPYPKDAQ
jgi:acetylornithine deacetylase/succinyl-diaminopimelate desuccinylase-like protein